MEFNGEEREIILEEREVNPKSKRKKNILIWIIVVAVVVLIAILFNSVFGGGAEDSYSSNSYKSPFVGIVYVKGTIGVSNVDSLGMRYGYQHQWTMDKIDELMKDEYNKGLMIFVDSPGGGVYESDELYFKIKEYKEVTGRPVYTAMGSMAASGGYYIAAPSDKIYANRNTWTGSIGVTIGTLFDVSGLLEKFGVKSVTIAEGANKSMGSGTEPLTKEQEDILRELVHEAYMQFVAVVSDERKIPMNKAVEIADGRIYSAKQALGLNLIDGIKTFEESKTAMLKENKLAECEFLDIVYSDSSFIGRMLSTAKGIKTADSDLSVVMEIVNKGKQFPIAYLYQQ